MNVGADYICCCKRVDFHKIPVWEIKNGLLLASGWNAIPTNVLLLSLMRETDASHQKRENESGGGRWDEGATSLSQTLIDGGEGTSKGAKLPFLQQHWKQI